MATPLEEILEELTAATKKFPTWPNSAIHALAVLQEEVGELTKETLHLTYEPEISDLDAFKKEAAQVAAMAIRFYLSLDRYSFQRSQQHTQAGVDDE